MTDEDSTLLAGNPEADICLTMVCNPYCQPCAEAHKVIARMLEHNSRIKVRYILTAHKDHFAQACLQMVSRFYEKGRTAIDEWYSLDGNERKALDLPEEVRHRERAEMELARHRQFLNRSHISATPTLLLDGYKLPPEYSFEDLEYILFD